MVSQAPINYSLMWERANREGVIWKNSWTEFQGGLQSASKQPMWLLH